YLERIYEGMHGKANIIGISQHPLRETKVFASEYEVAFPIMLDETHTYPVSNAYGITNVPSIFLIAPNEQVELTSVGWSRRAATSRSSSAGWRARSAPLLLMSSTAGKMCPPSKQVEDPLTDPQAAGTSSHGLHIPLLRRCTIWAHRS